VRQRIQQQITRAAVLTAAGQLSISLSIGVATLPGDAGSAAELVAAADSAMYRAKQASRLEPAPVREAS
jgi:diguanylate cyclase (GGDEF)-like protein